MTNKLFWDTKAREMFGVNLVGEVTVDTFYGALHPEDRRSKHEGTARMLGGTLEVVSEPMHGTQITVSIPFNSVAMTRDVGHDLLQEHLIRNCR